MNMKKIKWCNPYLLLCALIPLIITATNTCISSAADMEWRSESIIRFYERDTTSSTDIKVIPIYEYLELDMRNVSNNEGISLHFYGWGRGDLGDGDYFDDDFDGSLLHGYLDYTSTQNNFRLRAGRQYIFSGVTNESIDGLLMRYNFAGFSLSGFGGSPVSLEKSQGRSGDTIFGGRLAHTLQSVYEIGLSYETIADNSNDESRVGLDFALYLPGKHSINGLTLYNIDTNNVAEYSLDGRFVISDTIEFRPSAQRFMFDDLLTGPTKKVNVFNLIAAKNADETLTVYGGLLTWLRNEQNSFGFKIKHFDYDKRGDSSQLFSTLADWQPDANTMSGLELGLMNGERSEDRFLLTRLYIYRDNLLKKSGTFVSGDLMYVHYDAPIYGVDNSFFASLGMGRRFLDDDMELKISGDYSIDPYFDKDVRAMLVLKYNIH